MSSADQQAKAERRVKKDKVTRVVVVGVGAGLVGLAAWSSRTSFVTLATLLAATLFVVYNVSPPRRSTIESQVRVSSTLEELAVLDVKSEGGTEYDRAAHPFARQVMADIREFSEVYASSFVDGGETGTVKKLFDLRDRVLNGVHEMETRLPNNPARVRDLETFAARADIILMQYVDDARKRSESPGAHPVPLGNVFGKLAALNG